MYIKKNREKKIKKITKKNLLPIALPQAAPVRRVGMKTPAEILRP